MISGDQGLKRKVCEDIKDAYELFDVLQKETLVDRDNLLFLQALLYRMNKHELFDLAVNYAQNKGNLIHFKKPPAEPRKCNTTYHNVRPSVIFYIPDRSKQNRTEQKMSLLSNIAGVIISSVELVLRQTNV